MKNIFAVILSSILIAMAGKPASSLPVQAYEEPSGSIVGKVEQEIHENGLIVQTQDSWALNSNTYFEVALETPYTLQEGQYLAIDFEVTRHVYDYFICKFGVNGKLFSMGDSQETYSFHAINNDKQISVSQKFGFFFFFTADFKGTIYIGRDYIGKDNVKESVINSFRVQYDSSNVSRQSTVVWHNIYVTDEEFLPRESGNLLFDFSTLNTNDDKTVNDTSFASSKNLTIYNDDRVEKVTTIDGVQLNSSLNYAMVFGMKSKPDGVVDLSSEEYGDLYKNNVLSLLKFDLSSHPYVPSDGFAFNFYAITNCYFKMIIEDDNGNKYMPNIPSSGSTTFNCVDQNLMVKTIEGSYEAFKVNAKQSGTVYIPYSSLINCKYFQGLPVTNTGSLGKIKNIYLAIAFSLSPGKRIIFGSFADVDIKTETVSTIFDTAKLTKEQLNYDDVQSSTFAYPIGTSEHHINNLVIEKAHPSLMNTYKNVDLMNGLIAVCENLDSSLYTEESYKNLLNVLSTVKLALENVFLTTEEFDLLYEKLSLAKANLVFKTQSDNNLLPIILLIAGIVVCIGGASLLIVSIIGGKKKHEK